MTCLVRLQDLDIVFIEGFCSLIKMDSQIRRSASWCLVARISTLKLLLMAVLSISGWKARVCSPQTGIRSSEPCVTQMLVKTNTYGTPRLAYVNSRFTLIFTVPALNSVHCHTFGASALQAIVACMTAPVPRGARRGSVGRGDQAVS